MEWIGSVSMPVNSSIFSSSSSRENVANDEDGVEFSETMCSMRFNNDDSTDDVSSESSMTSSRASSVAQFSSQHNTLTYDDGSDYSPYITDDSCVDQGPLLRDDVSKEELTKGLNAAVHQRHQHIRVASSDSNTSTKRASSSVGGSGCDCWRLMLLRCMGSTRRCSELSRKGAGSYRGTMQTFTFADSKLGYLTAAKGALVVRVKSCRTARQRDDVIPPCIVPSVAAAGDADNDVTASSCTHIADETGNFTLVRRRWSALYRRMAAAETTGTHQMTDVMEPGGTSPVTGVETACGDGVTVIALALWRRLVHSLDMCADNFQPPGSKSYTLIS